MSTEPNSCAENEVRFNNRLLSKFISTFLIGAFLFATCVPQALAEDKIYFYHNDHLGSPLAMTNMAKEVVWERDYKPFGEEIDLLTIAPNTHSYTGKELDAETGLYYYGARYYDPVTGRFISVDPVGGKPDNPQTWNRYAYTLNNPYKYVDPDGEFAVLGIMGALALAHGAAWVGTQIAARLAGDPVQPGTIKHLDYRLSDEASDIVLGFGFMSLVGSGILGSAIETGVLAYPELMVAAGTPQGQVLIEDVGDFLQGAIPGTPPRPTISGFAGAATSAYEEYRRNKSSYDPQSAAVEPNAVESRAPEQKKLSEPYAP